MSLAVLALIVSLVVGIISISTVIWKGGMLSQDVKILIERHRNCPADGMKQELQLLKARNDIFWSVIQPHLASIIHSPEHKRRDELVDKLVSNQINWQELVELEPMLYMEANNGVEYKRLPAALFLARVRILLTEG